MVGNNQNFSYIASKDIGNLKKEHGSVLDFSIVSKIIKEKLK